MEINTVPVNMVLPGEGNDSHTTGGNNFSSTGGSKFCFPPVEVYLVLTIRRGKKNFPPVKIISVPLGGSNFFHPGGSKFSTISGGKIWFDQGSEMNFSHRWK